MSSEWDPDLYARFRAERSRPFYDLAAMVEPQAGMRVLDLGCGGGELTAWLHGELGAAETLGIDSSPAMLEQAQAHEGDGIHFAHADIATFEADEPFDLVFANASLQWVPDHERLLPALVRLLAPGGQLAVQMPRNWQHPSHLIAAALGGESPYREALDGYSSDHVAANVLEPARYAELLHALGFEEQSVRLEIYPQLLPGPEDVLTWVRGSILTAYRTRLPAELYAAFEEEYGRRLLAALDDTRPFFYPYPRVLFRGRQPR